MKIICAYVHSHVKVAQISHAGSVNGCSIFKIGVGDGCDRGLKAQVNIIGGRFLLVISDQAYVLFSITYDDSRN